MEKTQTRGQKAWVERLSEHEMPALCSAVRTLEKIVEDDTSSLAALGQSVLHDNALTARILRVANSAIYSRGRNPVTTVSRAAIILGFKALKNICITAKLLDSLLKNKNISEPVYERLLKLMAQSFQAGMLAQMMLEGYDDDTQEEVFIAALLHHVGESAFWSMGGELTDELDRQLRQSDDNQEEVIKDLLGTSFTKLSIGLAGSWHLGEMLVASLNDPNLRTPELQAIDVADRLSAVLVESKVDAKSLQACLKETAQLMNLSVLDVKRKVEACTQETVKLMHAYGAGILVRFLEKSGAQPEEEEPEYLEVSETMQLKMLRELTTLTTEKADLNIVLQTALEGIYRGIGMDRVAVLMINPRTKEISPRFTCGSQVAEMKTQFVLPASNGKTIFHYAMKQRQPLHVQHHQEQKWQALLNPRVCGITSATGFFLAALLVNDRCLGLIYCDRHDSRRKLEAEDFASFTHFVHQTNMCISVLSLKNG